MQFPDFDHKTKQWDRFKEFYNDLTPSGHFVLFEGGEFIITQGYFNPYQRRQYIDLNFTLYQTGDESWRSWLKPMHLTTPDGDEVKRSWLRGMGSQTMLIDNDTRHVVRLDGWANPHNRNPAMPVRFRDKAAMYCAGKNEPPVGRGPVKVTQPDPLNKDERKHVADVTAVCKAWYTFSGAADPHKWTHAAQSYSHHTNQWITQENYVARKRVEISQLMGVDYNAMPDTLKVQLVKFGIQSRTKTTYIPYLIKSDKF